MKVSSFQLQTSRIVVGFMVAASAGLAGCAGPGPKLFPVVPLAVESLPDGGTERQYDANGDGQADYCERLSREGTVEALRYDSTGDGTFDPPVVRDTIPDDDCRHLIMILDSIPFSMVQASWRQGRFRLFEPPSRVISPFPVMTDVCLSTFFGTPPCPGVESEYFDGCTLKNGYEVYVNEGNVPWQGRVDYHLSPMAHALAYLDPRPWYAHELRRIQDMFQQSDRKVFIAYLVGTSALGARIGRNGHLAGLVQLDRFCQWIMFKTRGRVHITLLSDHGHSLGASERIPLPDLLRELGYRVGNSLEKPGDVVVPEFGMVTCACIHTRNPQQVARDVVGIEGIDLTAYQDEQDRVVVLSRGGRACIIRSAAGFCYRPEHGDPLQLLPILDELNRSGRLDAEGFASDKVLMDATISHVYPDVVYRLWRAFHGLIQHTPDVLVSVRDGWHCGSPAMSRLVHMTAAHGNLKLISSSAFVMTTAGRLPDVLRMEQLGAALEKLGVPVRKPASTNETTTVRGSTVEADRLPAPPVPASVIE